MTNKTLKALLTAMENNHPHTLGEDFYVSIRYDNEKSFQIHVYHMEPYQFFFSELIIADLMAYATAFRLSFSIHCSNGVPVAHLTKF